MVGIKRSKFSFSGHGHVAYQIKENCECCNMVANILPADHHPSIFGIFRKMNIVLGMKFFLIFFWGHHKIGLVVGSFLRNLRSFLRSRIFFGVAKISNIFGVAWYSWYFLGWTVYAGPESGSFRPRSSSPPRRFAPAAFRPWSFRPPSRFAPGRFAPRRKFNLFCWKLCE